MGIVGSVLYWSLTCMSADMRDVSCAHGYETVIVYAEPGPSPKDGYTTLLIPKSVFDTPPFGIRSRRYWVVNLMATLVARS